MLTIIAPDKPIIPWVNLLKSRRPDLPIAVWPEVPSETRMILCWQAPEHSFDNLPKLGCICSMGAGVDHILSMSSLPENIPVVRLVDPKMNQDMFDYIFQCLERYRLNISTYADDQQRKQWLPTRYKTRKDIQITVLGLGQIGSHVARELQQAGYRVRGWRRSEQNLAHIDTFSGDKLFESVTGSQVIVNLLPLTSATENILNQTLFTHLADQACVINVARGSHLDENALLSAIRMGKVYEAYLDVFRTEPLPKEHPFWTHRQIHITPHIASLTKPETVVEQIIDNYQRLLSAKSLINEIDRNIGY